MAAGGRTMSGSGSARGLKNDMRTAAQFIAVPLFFFMMGLPPAISQIETLPLAPPRPTQVEPADSPDGEPADAADPDATDAADAEGKGLTTKPEFKRPFTVIGPRLPAPIDATETVSGQTAILRQLDKMTGGTETFEVPVGGEADFGRLRVALSACKAPPSGTLQGTMAHLTIWDKKRPAPLPVFQGWMFADSPALSAMDHPRFDVWVISCTISAGWVASGSE